MYGATIGKAAILATTATTNQAVCACTPYSGVYNRYLLLLLKALKTNFVGQGAGGAQPNISREKIVATIAALPTEAEQHRIVTKVDELMALCDQLEAQQTKGHQAHATLVKTLLDTLTPPNPPPGSTASRPDRFLKPVRSGADAAPPAPDESVAGSTGPWSRVAAHFDTLFTTESSIDALKQTILQLAVMGKLVPQDPNDEPASELLKRIQAEKARLVAEGKIKKDKPLPAIGEEEKPFELPAGWEWARLAELGVTYTGKTPPTSNVAFFDGGEIPFIGPGQISKDGQLLSGGKTLTEAARSETTIALPGDILMVCIGGSIGKTMTSDRELAFNQQLNSIRPLSISGGFLRISLMSSDFQTAVLTNSSGSATPIINKSKWESITVKIPPLPEQHRIVAKADELMALCDQLASQLKSAREVSGRYASAATAVALNAA